MTILERICKQLRLQAQLQTDSVNLIVYLWFKSLKLLHVGLGLLLKNVSWVTRDMGECTSSSIFNNRVGETGKTSFSNLQLVTEKYDFPNKNNCSEINIISITFSIQVGF